MARPYGLRRFSAWSSVGFLDEVVCEDGRWEGLV